MRTSFLAVVVVFMLAASVFSQETENVEDFNPCNGTWILRKQSSWFIERQEDGLIKTIPPTVTILDCGGALGALKEHLNNVKAVVRCTNSSDQGGETHVQTIQITCE